MYLFKRNGIYYLHYYDETEGRERRISTKCKTKPDALKFLTDFKKQLTEKLNLKFITLKQFRNEYLQLIAKTKSKSYYRSIEGSFNLLQQLLGDDIPLQKVSIREIEALINENFTKSKYGTAQNYRNLRAAFNKAVTWKYLSSNPALSVKLPRMPKPIPAFIIPEELNSILNNEKSTDLRDLYLLGYNTGMRLNEILNLRWSAVDLSKKEIKVEITETFETKDKEERFIPINNTLYVMLSNRLPKILSITRAEYVFQKLPGIRFNQFYVSKQFKKAVIKSKLNDKYHFHTLRHSFCSNLARKGVSMHVIMKLAGHSQISTTMIYTHTQNDSLHDAVRCLDEISHNINVQK